ncbi:MAG: transcriptional repressor [Bacteroidota bacterium]
MNEREENKLKKRKVKPTAIRILVLRYLMELKTATSLIDLENHFEKSDRSTLFRTLKTFESKGIIHKIDDGTGITKYALCLESCNCQPADQHFHFHCEKCNQTYCLTELNVPQIDLPTNFSMLQANLVIKGVCANCN